MQPVGAPFTFDRYLLAVKNICRGNGEDDILAELKANLESQLEEKESISAAALPRTKCRRG